MPKPSNAELQKSRIHELFARADRMWRARKLRNAFELFLAAAKAGDGASQLNIGYFYDKGLGVKRNKKKALQWYRRAFQQGDASAANNIATIWRDSKDSKRALSWFKRAAKMGDDSSNLEIALHYLTNKRDPRTALRYLDQVCASDRVSDGEMAKARKLRMRAQNQLTSVN